VKNKPVEKVSKYQLPDLVFLYEARILFIIIYFF